ncbi:hypothetical protein QN344_06040, partial [Mucilaginibacter sp. 5B2]|nr:hypothetical protein [Mucilaginibacter sp. 5B2]
RYGIAGLSIITASFFNNTTNITHASTGGIMPYNIPTKRLFFGENFKVSSFGRDLEVVERLFFLNIKRPGI